MITIEYGPNGKTISDFEIEYWKNFVVKYIESKQNFEILVSNEIMIHSIRALIAGEKISCKDVAFKYKDKIFFANEYGAIENWPRGFAELSIDVCEEILSYTTNKRRK